MRLAWMQLVCTLTTGWETGAWPGQELVPLWIPKWGMAKYTEAGLVLVEFVVY